jgi:hypothetical protein
MLCLDIFLEFADAYSRAFKFCFLVIVCFSNLGGADADVPIYIRHLGCNAKTAVLQQLRGPEGPSCNASVKVSTRRESLDLLRKKRSD